VMWANIALVIPFSIARLLARAPTSKVQDAFYLLMLTTCGLSVRELFGSFSEANTEVTFSSYPFLAILLVGFLYYLAEWIFSRGKLSEGRTLGTAVLITLLTVGTYSGLRTLLSVKSEFGSGYRPLRTPAGTVNVADLSTIAIFSFVRDHSNPGETIVDVAHGGAVNFSLQRATPIVQDLFQALMPSDSILYQDFESFRAAPPKFVIGNYPLRAEYGFSAALNGCSFPYFVWSNHKALFLKNKTFPVIEYIRANYSVVYQAGPMAVFAKKNNAGL